MSLSWQLRAQNAEAEVARLRGLLAEAGRIVKERRGPTYPWTKSEKSRRALRAAFARLPTRRQSYRDGLNTGLNWEDSYTPGGPWVYGEDGRNNDYGWIVYAKRSRQNRDLWLQGWRDGVAVKAKLSA